MRRVSNLMPRVCTFENVLRAWRKARRGKRGRSAVAAFALNLENELVRLGRELLDGTYRPGPCTDFRIRDPKPRFISAAPFLDRVVHHALCNVIEPVSERRFIAHSYACRAGRGTHAALDRCTAMMRRYPLALQGDVRQFFPSVDHGSLLERVARVIKDPHVLRLVETVVRHDGARGLPRRESGFARSLRESAA